MTEVAPPTRKINNIRAEIAAGNVPRGMALLDALLIDYPEWLEGHKQLCALRHISGEAGDFTASYARACAARPQCRALWLAWFYTIAQIRDWEAALAIVRDGEAQCGTGIGFVLAKLYVVVESGDDATAAHYFKQTEKFTDLGLEMCRARFGLRTGQYVWAEAAASRMLQMNPEKAWPYLSLAWRLQGDARADWLDDPARTIKAYDLDFAAGELAALAAYLRTLHTAKAPHIDQSVRGGTQTDRPLFHDTSPLIVTLREKIEGAVRRYVEELPPRDAAHPLLGVTRTQPIKFAGSWSVRLTGDGFHVAHVHPDGWISSAFYVALPAPEDMGVPPAGWISFGAPPPSLGLDLQPYCRIEPKPGRLVLFPSTMWHATEPFEAGERLVVAFDVARP